MFVIKKDIEDINNQILDTEGAFCKRLSLVPVKIKCTIEEDTIFTQQLDDSANPG